MILFSNKDIYEVCYFDPNKSTENPSKGDGKSLKFFTDFDQAFSYILNSIEGIEEIEDFRVYRKCIEVYYDELNTEYGQYYKFYL